MDAETLIVGALREAIRAWNVNNPTNQETDQQVLTKLIAFFTTAL